MTLSIGTLATEADGRDAVHIAVAPIVAPCDLRPGEHVDEHGRPGTNPVGIVDPFLQEPVRAGQRFWLFLYPNSVTSLRHEWTHPAFETHSPVEVQNAIQEYLEQRKARVMA